jgi:PST family polysaccharide transporter
MDLKQEAVRGVAWSAAEKWGIRVITFLVTLILARFVSPESFGLIAYATVFISFAGIFVEQGFSDAIVQFPTIEREHLDTAFWIGILMGTLLSIFTFATSGMIANVFHEPQLIPILKWLSPVFLVGALNSVQYSILRRKLAFRSLTVRSLICVLISGTVAAIMAVLGFGVWSLVARSLVSGVVSVITLWGVSDWRPSFRLSLNPYPWRKFS